MKKTDIRWIMLSLVFVVVFNVILFLLNSTYTTAFWVSYGFIHVAYLMLVLSSATMLKAKSVVFGYPLVYMSNLYFIAAFIIGVIFIIFKQVSFTIAFIPQFIIMGIYAFVYISNIISNEKTMEHSAESKQDIFYIKNASSEISLLMNQTTDALFKKKLEKLYDAFKSSQVRTFPVVAGLEKRMMYAIEDLKEKVSQQDYVAADKSVSEIYQLIIDRNSKISSML